MHKSETDVYEIPMDKVDPLKSVHATPFVLGSESGNSSQTETYKPSDDQSAIISPSSY